MRDTDISPGWSILVALAVLLSPVLAVAGSSSSRPSPELVQLEREVSLKLAHVRDEGPTEPAKRRKLQSAALLDEKAEKEIEAGDYRSAEDDLVKANAIATELSN
jgi:hypothetical protein